MNKFKIYILSIVCSLMVAAGFTSCIEDGVTTSPSHQPAFSTDTLRMGELLTLGASPTSRFVVYNRHDKILNISEISFRDDEEGQFRMNVDGLSGRRFSNIEIRPNDSIFVFVEATLAENGANLPVDVLAHIDFKVNGVTSTMPVAAKGQDVERLAGNVRFAADATLRADKPYLVKDSIVVEPGVCLTIPAGARLLMQEEAAIIVHGTLEISGTAERPVEITGHRTGYVAAQIPYEVMSGQWRGIRFAPESKDNKITFASIRNSEEGLILDYCGGTKENPALTITNSVVRNTKGYIIEAIHSALTAVGCEFSDASLGLVRLVGSDHTINHCTLANYYLFTAAGTSLQLEHLDPEDAEFNAAFDRPEDADLPWMRAEITNSIIYGLGSDLSHGDLTGLEVYLRNCLLKSEGTDDDNFINCVWGQDPLYGVDRENYIFDYRVAPESPALFAADPALVHPLGAVDRYGDNRLPSPTIGAYQSPR